MSPSAGVKILVTGKMSEEGLNELRKGRGFIVEYAPGLKGDELLKKVGDVNGLIIRTETPITSEVLNHAPRLSVICRAGIGVDHIDLEACGAKQVVVMNTPGANRVSTAEHALGLIFSLARHIPQATKHLKDGKWDRDSFTGVELQSKTLGIIGLGNIGQRVATRAQALSMKVIAVDPYLDKSMASAVNVKLFSLDHVLEHSDFITIHVPLTPETKGLANASFFKKMKKGSFFVNTSRGPVVVEEDLAKALTIEHLRGAALDVFNHEPIEKGNPLLGLENIILTPHVAGQTAESQTNMSRDAAMQIRDFFEEGAVINPIPLLISST